MFMNKFGSSLLFALKILIKLVFINEPQKMKMFNKGSWNYGLFQLSTLNYS